MVMMMKVMMTMVMIMMSSISMIRFMMMAIMMIMMMMMVIVGSCRFRSYCRLLWHVRPSAATKPHDRLDWYRTERDKHTASTQNQLKATQRTTKSTI